MKTINSLSGGKSSSLMAVKFPADYEVFGVVCIDDRECVPTDKALVDYANKKLENFIPEYGEFIATAEDDATLIAMMDLEQYIGREIIWVRGVSFDNLNNGETLLSGKPSFLPSWKRRYCTVEMKLLPIFKYWFENIGAKVNMRIGFRFDEFSRMERFVNSGRQGNLRYPVACSLKGQKLQRWEDFDYRFCSFPLIQSVVTKNEVTDFWLNKWTTGSLFSQSRKITFPAISNCVGCFHKNISTLAAQAVLQPKKMNWFAQQEKKGKGTFRDDNKTYEEIIANAPELAKEVLYEIMHLGQSCDSGGCTD